jgi:WhiB family redox-sensing transcriptional regulator
MGALIINFRPSGDYSWQKSARCADAGPSMMFPHDADFPGIARAKAVCERCPVRALCLDEAQTRGERFGIWGGLTPDERREARRRERRAARKTAK